MGRVERVYIRLYKRYAREEDALKGREGGTPERFVLKTFHGAGSPQSQSIFRDAETSRGAQRKQNLCHFAHKKEDAEKI